MRFILYNLYIRLEYYYLQIMFKICALSTAAVLQFFQMKIAFLTFQAATGFSSLSMLLPVSLYLLCQAFMVINEDGS